MRATAQKWIAPMALSAPNFRKRLYTDGKSLAGMAIDDQAEIAWGLCHIGSTCAIDRNAILFANVVVG